MLCPSGGVISALNVSQFGCQTQSLSSHTCVMRRACCAETGLVPGMQMRRKKRSQILDWTAERTNSGCALTARLLEVLAKETVISLQCNCGV